jgi:hypothetical protein
MLILPQSSARSTNKTARTLPGPGRFTMQNPYPAYFTTVWNRGDVSRLANWLSEDE